MIMWNILSAGGALRWEFALCWAHESLTATFDFLCLRSTYATPTNSTDKNWNPSIRSKSSRTTSCYLKGKRPSGHVCDIFPYHSRSPCDIKLQDCAMLPEKKVHAYRWNEHTHAQSMFSFIKDLPWRNKKPVCSHSMVRTKELKQ